MTLSELTVKDVMTRGVISVPIDYPVMEVAKIMAKQKVSGIAVIDENGEVMGMIAEMDMLKIILDESLMDTTVEDIMNYEVQSVKPSTSLKETVGIMKKKGIHRLLVLSEPGVGASYRPVGILSASDIISKVK